MARILVVDDDLFFLELCAGLLEKEGYTVDRALSGEVALQQLSDRKYHLVITDLFMPGMSGLEFLSIIKGNDPSTDVIMVTGNADVETAISALKNGARDYIVKPFNHDEFKHIVSVSLEQRRLIEENHDLRDLLNLFQIGQSISNCIELEKLHPLITDALAKELGVNRALAFFRQEGGELELSEFRGFTPSAATTVAPLFFRTYLSDENNISYANKFLDNLSLIASEVDAGLDLREALVFYVKTKSQLQGVVVLFNSAGDNLPTSINYNRFTFMLDQASLAFDNAIRYASMKNLIYIDELTGLFNYRYLDVALERELKRVERYGSNVSVLFLDLDRFKEVNDTHGHLVGSQVLREVGALLKKSVREVDVVVRYGGDEYTVILSEIGGKEAAIVAERIRRGIELHPFLAEQGMDIRLTASLGYACFPEDSVNKKQLLEMADQAMYRGKASGKNRIFRATALLDGEHSTTKEQD